MQRLGVWFSEVVSTHRYHWRIVLQTTTYIILLSQDLATRRFFYKNIVPNSSWLKSIDFNALHQWIWLTVYSYPTVNHFYLIYKPNNTYQSVSDIISNYFKIRSIGIKINDDVQKRSLMRDWFNHEVGKSPWKSTNLDFDQTPGKVNS